MPARQWLHIQVDPAGFIRLNHCQVIAFRALVIIVCSGLLVFQQVQFSGTWGDGDISLKIWSTGWLCIRIVTHGVILYICLLIVYFHSRFSRTFLDRTNLVIHLTKCGWWFGFIGIIWKVGEAHGTAFAWFIVLLLVEPAVWVLGGRYSSLVYQDWDEVLPPQEVARRPVHQGRSEQNTATESATPEEIRNKIVVFKYRQVQSSLGRPRSKRCHLGAVCEARFSGRVQVENQEAKAPVSTGSLKSSLEAIVAKFQRCHSVSSGMPSSRKLSDIGVETSFFKNPAQQSIFCVICFCEYGPDDDVAQMPCDLRHIFHQSCLNAWLLKSTYCPICRGNVIETIGRIEGSQPEADIPTEAADRIAAGADTAELGTVELTVIDPPIGAPSGEELNVGRSSSLSQSSHELALRERSDTAQSGAQVTIGVEESSGPSQRMGPCAAGH